MSSVTRRSLVAVLCSTFAAVSLPGSALAHGAWGHRGPSGSRYQFVCSEAGAWPGGHAYSHDNALSGLSESQLEELKVACEKLAAAASMEQKADEAAAQTFHEALQKVRATLDEACPALREHPGAGGWAQLSSACQEALKTAAASAHEAGKALYTAREEAAKPFQAALGEFQTKVKPILEAIESSGQQNARRGSRGYPRFGGVGFGGRYPH